MRAKGNRPALFKVGLQALLIGGGLQFSAAAVSAAGATCTVNAAALHQQMDGFGAGVVFLDSGLDPLTGAQMDALYGTTGGQFGLTLIRVRIAPDGNNTTNMVDAQEAYARGARILATPWTPPAAMKDNNNIVGGSVPPSQYAAFAAYLNSYASAMAANGSPLAAISIQNEPDFLATYESCLWSADQFHTFFVNNAGSIHAPVIMPESYGFNFAESNETLSDPVAAANVSYIGGHLYGGTIQNYALALSLNKHVWMTEYLVNDQTIATAVTTGRQISDCLTVGNMSAYIWWKCIGDANGLLNAAGVPQLRGYVMAQFSRFVRPGDYRVDVRTNTGPMAISAFNDAVSGRFAIVAVNDTALPVTQTFTLQGVAPAALTPWITSGTQFLSVQAPIAISSSAFTYTVPANAVVTFATIGAPQISNAPAVSLNLGSPVSYWIPASNSPTVYSATGLPPGLSLNPQTGIVTGTPTTLGNYPVSLGATNAGGTASAAVAMTVATGVAAQFANLSLLGYTGTGNNVMVVGFILQGPDTKQILIRASGPALAAYGVSGTLAAPQLQLYQGGTVLLSNTAWSSATNAPAIALASTAAGAANFPSGSANSAMLTALGPSADTAIVSGADGGSGVALMELFDASPASVTRLINLSGRASVGPASPTVTGGIVISGNAPKRLLVRAVGPSLANYGIASALADPSLQVLQGSTSVASNAGWNNDPQTAAISASVGAFALNSNSKDAALLLTLSPGLYTVQVTSVSGQTGVTLLETYDVP
jgi:glucuronoarabinoxylan endo-1,4-beta-xylanase